jgi:transposase
MEVVFTHCAGLDVHKKSITACRIVPDPMGLDAEGVAELQTFGTMTIALLALVDWLAAAGITHVAMESTGAYWKPVYNLLEGAVTVLFVQAAHVKNVPGRKTDKADARWLATLMRYGLLQASFLPPAGQRDFRDLTRYRTKLVQERVREVNRMQGVLERANIKLASVAAAIMGGSGRAMLEALIAGRADPTAMAELAKRRMRRKIPLLAQALTGLVRDHHRRLLAIPRAHSDLLDEQIATLRTAIEASLATLSADEMVPPTAHAAAGASLPPAPEAPPALTFPRAVALLETIPGVNRRGAELIVAEIGIDMTRFGTAPRLAAWAGVAPGNNASAGQHRSSPTRRGNQALRAGLTPLAQAAAHTKETYVSTLYGRLAARRGKPRAIMAVAHAIMVSVFPMRMRHEPYHELGAHSFDERRRHSTVDRLAQRIERLGYRVHLEPVATTAA